MFHRIVVPLDQTDFAATALPTACALAARIGATLALLTVLTPQLSEVATVTSTDKDRQEARHRLQGVARATAHDCTPPMPMPIIAVRDGVPAGEILSYAEEIEADLICMATHGRAGLKRVIVGSVAERVLHDAPVPVLLIAPDMTVTDFPVRAAVAVPLDGSPHAESALPHAVSLAKTLDAPLTLVRIWDISAPMTTAAYAVETSQTVFDKMEEATEESVVAYLDAVAARIRGVMEVRTVHVRGGAVEGLDAFVRAERPALVVMGTHGRGGVPRWVLGSVAFGLVRTSVAPVLLIGDACVRASAARLSADY